MIHYYLENNKIITAEVEGHRNILSLLRDNIGKHIIIEDCTYKIISLRGSLYLERDGYIYDFCIREHELWNLRRI